jgi:hypothetical protein
MNGTHARRDRTLIAMGLVWLAACTGGAETVVQAPGTDSSTSSPSVTSSSTSAAATSTATAPPTTPPPAQTTTQPPVASAPAAPQPVAPIIVPVQPAPVITPPHPAPPPATPPVTQRPPEPPPADATPAPTNGAPTIAGSPPTDARPGVLYSFTPRATDPEGDALTFSVANKPAWLTFDAATGAIRGTPRASDIGAYSGIVISVSDGKADTRLPAFTVTIVQVANGSATILWTPPTQNADGSSLNDLAGYLVEYGTDASALSESVRLTNPGLSSYMLSDLLPGKWYFAVKSFNRAGAESAISNLANKTIQ